MVIRRKGHSWEQRKLTDCAEFFSGLTYTPADVRWGFNVADQWYARKTHIVDDLVMRSLSSLN